MSFDTEETIAAVATPAGAGGICVIRISGSRAAELLAALFRSKQSPVAAPRMCVFGEIVDPATGRILDRGLAAYFPGPASFTGEDTVELHLHGSPLLARMVLRAAYAGGARAALPGEFTKRAYLNGKIDLLQAEAIGAVIAASSERALLVAQDQLGGRLSRVVDEIAEPLRDALAEVEAGLDFPDEDIVPVNREGITHALSQVRSSLQKLRGSYRRGRVIRQGIRVLLCGAPNVGKSSLLNCIVGTNRAIVSPIPGTTRDEIEEGATFEGYSFVLCDVAGFRETADPIEQEGVVRARARLDWADIVLAVYDSPVALLDATDDLRAELTARDIPYLAVLNKSDCHTDTELHQLTSAHNVLTVSATQATRINELLRVIIQRVLSFTDNQHSENDPLITEERHAQLLDRCDEALTHTSEAITSTLPMEVVAAALRHTLGTLDELVGRTETEDILGRIFSKYCVGK